MPYFVPMIADTSFNRLGAIDDYASLIWTQRYYTSGDFEIVLPVSSKAVSMAKKDYYVILDNRRDVGIIERISIARNATGQERMILSGRFLTSILGRRIIEKQTQINSAVGAGVKKLINQNIINAQDTARRIPNFTYGTFASEAATVRMQQQFTGTNLLTAISQICLDKGFGISTTLEDGNFVFSLIMGVDRSFAQNVRPRVIFSDQYDNLTSSDYEENYENIITDVLVAGEGEGTARKTAWARRQTLSGLARYESFQDARNASSNNGEIAEDVYLEQLRADGMEHITSFTQAFAGEVSLRNYQIGVDVSIGDIVAIKNARWGISMNARIVELIESINEAGVYSVVPTFGE